MKNLIVNADDFGFTRDVNAGIVHAHRNGILTATTLMANGDAFDDAVRLAHETPSLDIGCHLVLIHGQSLLTNKPFPETWKQLLIRLAKGQIDIYSELRAQIEKIVSAGLKPSHLDSHKHTHIVPSVFNAVVRLAKEFQIPYVRLPFDETARLLGFGGLYYRRLAANLSVTDHFLGFRLTGSLTESELSKLLSELPEGTTELMCHPGFLGAELPKAPTRLKESRVREIEALTSPRIRQQIAEQQIRLTSFAAKDF